MARRYMWQVGSAPTKSRDEERSAKNCNERDKVPTIELIICGSGWRRKGLRSAHKFSPVTRFSYFVRALHENSVCIALLLSRPWRTVVDQFRSADTAWRRTKPSVVSALPTRVHNHLKIVISAGFARCRFDHAKYGLVKKCGKVLFSK